MKLSFYGGVGEIGGNKFLLEDGGAAVFLDFGMPFGKRYRYFEEYLKPRAGVGLLDILEMGLLPPFSGVYRDDLLLPVSGEEIWRRYNAAPGCREVRANGVLLSHAHLDHSGYISFLREDIPIYCTAMTAFVAKAIQDSAPIDFEKEVCYSIRREFKGDYLGTEGPRYQRQFRLLDGQGLSPDARVFWNWSPAKTRPLAASPLAAGDSAVAGLNLRFYPLDHSVYGACGYAVETSAGWVAYTGDLRLHGERGLSTQRFVDELTALHPRVLLCEGTRIGGSEDRIFERRTEDLVEETALEIVRGEPGLVVADFGPRNVERLRAFLRIARQTGRRLAVLAKDAYLLDAMHLVADDIPALDGEEPMVVYQDLKGTVAHWEEARVRKPHAERLVGPREVAAEPGAYILCFSFWDIKNLVDIRPEGGTYIYSSSEAYNEEQELDLRRLRAWVKHFGLRLAGDPETDERPLHASGHASGPDLVDFVRRVQPEVLVPIHTEQPAYFAAEFDGTNIQVRLPSYGRTMEFA